MSANLGNINHRLRLQCKPCGWIPPENTTMEAVKLHFEVDHDTAAIALDLLPACHCGASMTHTESSTIGDQMTDYFKCGACGNTGHVTRKPGTHPMA